MNNSQLVDSKKKLIFLILVLGSVTAIGPMTIDMYLPAFAAISHSFAAPENLVQLSLTTYFIGLSLSQLIYGPIIDRYGKKLPLYVGLSLFIISSIACCFAHNIYELIFFRFFQAMGACIGVVAPRAIVRDIFSPQDSARIYSHLMLVMGLAPILAPIVGGITLAHFHWKAIFVILAAFGLICLIISKFAIPTTRQPNKDDKLSDAFSRYRGILRDKTFLRAALSGSFIMSGLFAYITAAPFAYLEFFDLSPSQFSLLFSLNSLGFIAAAQINARLLRKYSIHNIVRKTLWIPAAAATLLFAYSFTKLPQIIPFTIFLFAFVASIGSVSPNTSALALSNQSKHTGSASALLGTIQFGCATIISFLVSKLHDGSLTSMAIVLLFCATASNLCYRVISSENHS